MNRHSLLLLALAALGTCLAFLGLQATGTLRVVLGIGFFLFVVGALALDYYVLQAISRGLVPLLLGVACLTLAACQAIDHGLFVRSAVRTESDIWMAVPTPASVRGKQKHHTVGSTRFGRGRGRLGDLILEVGVMYDDGEGHYRWAMGSALPFAFPDEDETIAVAYLPADPSQARIDGWMFWHLPALLAVVGGVLVVAGVVLLWRKRKAESAVRTPSSTA